VRAAWWHEQQDEVVDGFLVEPHNQGRAETTWEPSHEWRLAEVVFQLVRRSPGSTLVLLLNQEIILDFILPFLQPCGLYLTPLDTGSLEPSLLVFSTPGGLTSNDLSRLFFTCTNTSQAATCSYKYLAKNQSTQHCQSLISS
jgi:hypothetical protein